MRKLSTFVLLLAILAGASTASFAQDEAVTVIPAGETVKIGSATDLSNVLGPAGLGILNGAQLAVDQFNAEGGLLGFEVELVSEDDRCDGAEATSVANRFVADPSLVAVVGHACSGATIPASEIYEDARIVSVSPSSTAAAVTGRGLSTVNRVAFSDSVQGIVAARYMQMELGAETIAILHDNSSYGLGLAEVVQAAAEELGLEVVAFDAIDPEEQDYRPQLTVIAGSEPDVLYFGGYAPQGALIISQMSEVGLEDSDFFSADGVYGENFLELAGENAEGAYASHGRPIADNEDFIAAYTEAFDATPGEQGPFAEEAYDSALVILTALTAVAEVDADGNLVIDREALIAAVREVSELEGISGLISCTASGECATPLIDISLVEDGEWGDLEIDDALQVDFGAE
jgi:branched-chain amino acid transport system substrate-binding protein